MITGCCAGCFPVLPRHTGNPDFNGFSLLFSATVLYLCCMLKSFFLLVFLAGSGSSFAQSSIDLNDAGKHIGDSVTICAKAFGVTATDKITFINVGADYPNAPLTVVIYAKDYANFKAQPATGYAGKQVCITGTLKSYKGKTELLVTEPGQVQIQ